MSDHSNTEHRAPAPGDVRITVQVEETVGVVLLGVVAVLLVILLMQERRARRG